MAMLYLDDGIPVNSAAFANFGVCTLVSNFGVCTLVSMVIETKVVIG